MVALPHDQQAPSLLGTAAGDLALRVAGSTLDGRIVRLKSSKCTIGAGRQCTLRLRAPGVGRLHCLVLRGAGEVLVRRWSPDTRLNGAAFDVARLRPGDRLSVGPIELEVVEADDARLDDDAVSAAACDSPPSLAPALEIAELQRAREELAADVADREKQLRALQEAISAAQQDLADKQSQAEQVALASDAELGALRRQIEQAQQDLATRSEEAANAAAALQESELRRAAWEERRVKLEEERDSIGQERDSLAGEIDALRSELAAQQASLQDALQDRNDHHAEADETVAERERSLLEREEALAQQEAELNHVQRQLEAERHARDEEFEQRAKDLDQQESDLGKLRTELDDRKSELAAAQQRSAEENQRAKRRLEEFESDLQRQQAELAAEQRRFQEEHQAWHAQRRNEQEELERARAELERHRDENAAFAVETPSRSNAEADGGETAEEFTTGDTTAAAAPPADQRDVMDRLRSMVDWADDQEDAGVRESIVAEESASPPVSPVEAAEPAPSQAAADDGDEESIEDYMRRLMQRVQGSGAPQSYMPSPPPAPAKAEIPPAEARPAEQPDASQTQDPPTRSAGLPSRKRAGLPPELSSNLAAMRDLANSSAREAIDTSTRRRWAQAGVGKIVVGATGFLTGAGLLWASSSAFDVAFLGGGLSLIVAVFWSLQGALIFRNVRMHRDVGSNDSTQQAEALATSEEEQAADSV